MAWIRRFAIRGDNGSLRLDVSAAIAGLGSSLCLPFLHSRTPATIVLLIAGIITLFFASSTSGGRMTNAGLPAVGPGKAIVTISTMGLFGAAWIAGIDGYVVAAFAFLAILWFSVMGNWTISAPLRRHSACASQTDHAHRTREHSAYVQRNVSERRKPPPITE